MSQIPITREYAEAVGEWCQQVESRSLLHEKLAFPKQWGGDNKENQASNWSLMRIASNGATLLKQKAAELERKANGRNIETEEKQQRLRKDAEQCRKLAGRRLESGLDALRPKHSARFLELLHTSYSNENLRIVEARLEGRLAINLAEGVIQNAGINLDRIFGLPLINGSSVKGVARSVALAELKNNKDDGTLDTFVRVFGVAESDWKGDLAEFADIDRDSVFGNARLALPIDLKGAVTFLQSTPTNDARIVVDITNVHYPNYYRYEGIRDQINQEADPQKKRKLQQEADEALMQKEHPNPNYFPAVERGAEFAFPLLLNGMRQDQELLKAAERWLIIGLTQQGIGAKTAAGYGWFSDISAEVAEQERRAADERAAREEEQRHRAEQRVQEENETEKRRAAKAEAANFEKLPPAMQLAQIATNDGKFENFFKIRFKALSDDEKATIVEWFASPDGASYWLKIKTNNKRIWPQIVPELHRVKKAKGLKLP